MSEFESIIYEVDDGRARITLNRPEKLNALSLKLQSELNEALWEADNDNAVHCAIIRGAGRAFSAGYDLSGADGKYRYRVCNRRKTVIGVGEAWTTMPGRWNEPSDTEWRCSICTNRLLLRCMVIVLPEAPTSLC